MWGGGGEGQLHLHAPRAKQQRYGPKKGKISHEVWELLAASEERVSS